MTIEAATLRFCKLPNLERLARSLCIAVDTSGSKERRHRRLVRQIAAVLEAERKASEPQGGWLW